MRPAKTIVVVVDTNRLGRVREALRAAVGLGLRGDTVRLATTAVAAPALDSQDPDIRRGLATLRLLGRQLGDASDLADWLTTADVVQVWT